MHVSRPRKCHFWCGTLNYNDFVGRFYVIIRDFCRWIILSVDATHVPRTVRASTQYSWISGFRLLAWTTPCKWIFTNLTSWSIVHLWAWQVSATWFLHNRSYFSFFLSRIKYCSQWIFIGKCLWQRLSNVNLLLCIFLTTLYYHFRTLFTSFHQRFLSNFVFGFIAFLFLVYYLWIGPARPQCFTSFWAIYKYWISSFQFCASLCILSSSLIVIPCAGSKLSLASTRRTNFYRFPYINVSTRTCISFMVFILSLLNASLVNNYC